MYRFAWITGIVLLGSGSVSAQPAEVSVKKITVTPAAAPAPALRYQLLPELRDTTPGNAALVYYRAFAPDWSSGVRGNKVLQEKVDKALDLSPAEVKSMPEMSFVRDWAMLKEVDRAARRAYCDWEITPRVREDGIMLLLPDAQGTREFARYLKLRCKLELADRQFDKAIRTLQTGMQLGRHMADNPTLIQALVGTAITAVSLSEVEDWISTPGSPNLYWALGLPQPFIDQRKPHQGERLFIDSLFPGFRDALADPSKASQLMRPDEMQNRLKLVHENSMNSSTYMLLLSMRKYPMAKTYLKARGWTESQVDALPAPTAVVLYEIAVYDRICDEMFKWLGQPYWISRPGAERAERELKEEVVRSGSPGLSLAGLLLPAVGKVQFAGTRIDRSISMLRTIEALRMYAAAKGAFPSKLDDITETPVPVDPVTGKQFEYRSDGDRAWLTAPPPADEQAHTGNSVRYEITLKK